MVYFTLSSVFSSTHPCQAVGSAEEVNKANILGLRSMSADVIWQDPSPSFTVTLALLKYCFHFEDHHGPRDMLNPSDVLNVQVSFDSFTM